MASDHSVGFEPADELAKDRDSVRRRFWTKLKRVVVKLPFAEDLLAAYYCAFDRQTPRHVQAALWEPWPISSCRSISSRTCCRCSASPTTPRCSPPRSGWSPPTSCRSIATPRAQACSAEYR